MAVDSRPIPFPRVTDSPEATRSVGRELGQVLAHGDVVILTGPLGAGKTELVGGIGEALGVDRSAISSPTFTLLHEYEGGREPLFHIDFYRLESAEEALALGLEDYFAEGISVIEWGERFPELVPDLAKRITITPMEGNRRKIAMEAQP